MWDRVLSNIGFLSRSNTVPIFRPSTIGCLVSNVYAPHSLPECKRNATHSYYSSLFTSKITENHRKSPKISDGPTCRIGVIGELAWKTSSNEARRLKVTTISSPSERSLFACIPLNGIYLTALLDTVAELSCASLEFLQKYLSDVVINDISDSLNLSSVDGSDLPFVGFVELQFNVFYISI